MPTPCVDLSLVSVRLVADELEMARWADLMNRYHPQGWRGMVGEQLAYVAVDERGCWLACLGWCAAAQCLQDREAWMGWSPVQRRQRLHLVVNNARFLLLPEIAGQANLASRVLGLNLRCLSADWQERYDHPVWVAETFVEQDQQGSCYKACGWLEVGETKGFRRTQAEGYRKHGVVRRYFIRPLSSGVRELLRSRQPLAVDRPLPRLEPSAQPLAPDPAAHEPGLLALIRREVTDVRKRGGRRYELASVLGILILGILSGQTTCAGIARWATTLPEHQRRVLGCLLRVGGKRPVPSANTFRYVLQDLPTGQLEHLIRLWCTQCGINLQRTTLAIDGKVLCGSATANTAAKAQLNLYDSQRNLPLGQCAIPEKTNEITAIRELVQHYDLQQRVLTMDAAHTNHATMNLLVEKGGSRCASSKVIHLVFSSGSKTHSQQQG